MRIALIGARGQLGTDLQTTLRGTVDAYGHGDVEISDPASVRSVVSRVNYDVVVNCAAYNLVDKAEEEAAVAFLVNGLGPRNLALACTESGTALLHVSTDYVFGLDDSRNVPLTEDDPTGPLSAYGTGKLAGEFFVRSLCPRSYVVRTCGLYGRVGVRGKGNFVETMLRLGAERRRLSVVDDQHCTPTSTVDLARAIARLVETEAFGLYHATNSGATTWCRFAREVFRLAELDVEVTPITSAEFGAKARRPGYSVLNGDKLASVIGSPLPAWTDALQRYLEDRSE